MRMLADGRELPVPSEWYTGNYPDIAFADLGSDPVLPDPVDTVLEISVCD